MPAEATATRGDLYGEATQAPGPVPGLRPLSTSCLPSLQTSCPLLWGLCVGLQGSAGDRRSWASWEVWGRLTLGSVMGILNMDSQVPYVMG